MGEKKAIISIFQWGIRKRKILCCKKEFVIMITLRRLLVSSGGEKNGFKQKTRFYGTYYNT